MAFTTDIQVDIQVLKDLSLHVFGILRDSDSTDVSPANVTALNNLYSDVIASLKIIVDSQIS